MGNLNVIPDSRIILFLKALNIDFPLILISYTRAIVASLNDFSNC